MEDSTIRELIEAAVAESFDAHLRALHGDIIERVLNAVTPSLSAASAGSAKELNDAIVSIQRASQQVEILKNLLEGASGFSARTALFILRGNVAVGWQARGFSDNDSIKAIMIESGSGVVGEVVHNYMIEKVSLSSVDSKFAQAMGAALDDECILLPLVVRGKVAAVLYADAGSEGGAIDVQALELLARAAGDWIELQALRKAAGAPAHYPTPTRSAKVEEEAAKVPARVVVTKSAAEVKVTSSAAVPQEVAAAASAPSAATSSVAAHEPVASANQAAPAPSPAPPEVAVDDEELHKKARRFAKLLVDEIVLYNQHKVMEGRQQHDLYDRLKEDIEKSRATYDKRYANTSVSNADYFNQALIAGLADHNPHLLGSNFPR